MHWKQKYADKVVSPEEAVLRIPRGRHIFIGSGAAQPVSLVEGLRNQAEHFADNTIVHLLTLGPAPYADPRYEGHFRHNAFFIGANVRRAINEGRADYTPVFLSQIPSHMRSRRLPVDAALIQCSPPDQFGFVNLGLSVDVVLAAIECAELVIAEINPNVPHIHGAGYAPIRSFDALVESQAPLLEHLPEEPDEVAMEIGRNVASLIEDGSTLQLGIGAIPDATLKALANKNHLGIWTEMFSDGVMDLIEAGVITGKYKPIHHHKVTSSFSFGSKRLYDYLDRNPTFTFHPSDYTNDPIRIAKQHKMVAINSALQIDLSGQVCADSIGTKFYSGIGGQVDFIRGAGMCPDGKPIIALPSTAKGGQLSRIVATLNMGAGVVTSRGDVRFVVTEYGIADLMAKSIRERTLALISIAHPDFRSELLEESKERRYVFTDQIELKGTYPRELESEVSTSDGVPVRVRPIKPTDEQKLTQFFGQISENTLYKRFMNVIHSVAHKERQYFMDVDYEENMAIVVETLDNGRESEILGIAQYFTDPATRYADIAFIIGDAWQRRGLGKILIDKLIEAARRNGVKGFAAELMASNQAMLHLLHKSGLDVSSTLDGEVYRLSMPFDAESSK